jgi:hypothetical protein|tara:strand:+ start:1311 stop:1481 length:171 start_codon:yes stop_codon:yes gene_type:complete
MRGKIDNFDFVLEEETNRIFVYQQTNEDPIYYINVYDNISEKDFHYEIMDFVAKQK